VARDIEAGQSQVGGTERQTRRDVFFGVIIHSRSVTSTTDKTDTRRHADGIPREDSPTLAVVKEPSAAELDALIDEATVDCYNEDEELAGFAVMIEDNLVMPFETTVLGVTVTVKKISRTESGIVAICVRGKHRQAIPILDLPLPDPPPQGTEWIAAYRRWAG